MTDVHDKKIRSYNMSRIRDKDTKPEMLVRKFLFAHGLRYRIHVKTISGKPDIVLTKFRTVIFVHGCFWHGHEDCRYFVIPRTRTEWWLGKINGNKRKDFENEDNLKRDGWRVLILWECDLRSLMRGQTLAKTLDIIINGDSGN